MELLISWMESADYLFKAVVIISGYLLTFVITDVVFSRIILKGQKSVDADGDGKIDGIDDKLIKEGRIIGKCENLIILTFVLAGELTGLTLIFAAKSLARRKDIDDNAGFFLAGTMVNFTTTLLLGYILKFTLDHFFK